MELIEKKITLDDVDLLSLLGYNDSYLQKVENKFQSIITVRGNNITIKGKNDEILQIEKVFKELIYILKKNGSLSENDIDTVLDFITVNEKTSVKQNFDKDSFVYAGVRESIHARTKKQLEYCSKVQDNDLVFAIGPAGTGKTYLAVAIALAALKRGEVSKLILSRPAVEAGESLGFLPGDLKEKLDPYLKPLTDALFEMLPAERLKSMMERGIIEIIPLAYMRGRTLNNSFIILDEAQNATATQMKMFLTRLGVYSKAIVTGDITQIDLASRQTSGLINANNVLQDIKGIEFVYFTNRDVVRHRLVAEIIRAYENEARIKENVNNNEINNIINEKNDLAYKAELSDIQKTCKDDSCDNIEVKE